MIRFHFIFVWFRLLLASASALRTQKARRCGVFCLRRCGAICLRSGLAAFAVHALPWAALEADFIKPEPNEDEMENRKKDTLYRSHIQLSFSCFFSAQLIVAETIGSEFILLRLFFSVFSRGCLRQERSFFRTVWVHWVVFQDFFYFGFLNCAKECIVTIV